VIFFPPCIDSLFLKQEEIYNKILLFKYKFQNGKNSPPRKSQLYRVYRGASDLKRILQNPEKKKANEACKNPRLKNKYKII